MLAACDYRYTDRAPWPFAQADGRCLPFRSQAADVVISNAVIEHVGGESEQREYIAEHVRVGRHTTEQTWARP